MSATLREPTSEHKDIVKEALLARNGTFLKKGVGANKPVTGSKYGMTEGSPGSRKPTTQPHSLDIKGCRGLLNLVRAGELWLSTYREIHRGTPVVLRKGYRNRPRAVAAPANCRGLQEARTCVCRSKNL